MMDDPLYFRDFRPISLSNFIYKIIAKITANQLKPILSHNIYSEQFSFLEDKQIHEVDGVTKEIPHSLKSWKKRGLIIKIDLSKSYDKLTFSYIILLMTHLGLEVSLINWRMSYLTTTSFEVLFKCSTSNFFQAQGVLRQGYPLSPLLFLLVAEGLGKILREEKITSELKGVLVEKNLTVTHLLFVDDVLLFRNGS